MEKLDTLRNNLMNQLTEDQKNEVTNLTNSILNGFNLNN